MATIQPKIEVRNLYKVFGKEPEAQMARIKSGLSKEDLLKETGHVLGLRDINFSVFPGEIYVVMGLSGSGKSTLVRMLNRLVEATSGEILIDGRDVLALDQRGLAKFRQRKMAMVFQGFGLLSHRTVLENVRFGLDTRKVDRTEANRTAMQWIERVDLVGYGNYYPSQLSGGMRQRVGLARALANDPDILLMDEAFSALDPLIRADMQSLLLRLQSELRKTIVFITHDLDEAMHLADRIMILKDGAVQQQGDPQTIISRPEKGYVERFVAQINRAKVIRISAIMEEGGEPAHDALPIEESATLDSALKLCGGDMSARFAVFSGGRAVGHCSMKGIMAALAGAPENGRESEAIHVCANAAPGRAAKPLALLK